MLKGGYPFWHDDVPKGMSRDQYKRLEKKKPKNKSMKVWIRENKKDMGKYTKKIYTKKRKNKKSQKITQKGGFCPACFFAPAAFAGAAIGGAATFMKSKSSSSQYSNINGKKRSSQEDILKENINGIKTIKDISRKGRIITVNDKKIKSRDVKTAKLLYKKLREKYMK